MSTVYNGSYLLYVGLPSMVGSSVGMGYSLTESNALSANFTLCHSYYLQCALRAKHRFDPQNAARFGSVPLVLFGSLGFLSLLFSSMGFLYMLLGVIVTCMVISAGHFVVLNNGTQNVNDEHENDENDRYDRSNLGKDTVDGLTLGLAKEGFSTTGNGTGKVAVFSALHQNCNHQENGKQDHNRAKNCNQYFHVLLLKRN